jgi:hypothetical protein
MAIVIGETSSARYYRQVNFVICLKVRFMETIKAADNLVIEIGQGLWQLASGRPNERPLLIATVGAVDLVYRPVFGEARQLPAGGGLATKDVDEVVVGWSHTDRAWHLGLLLKESVAENRGGRWCELARWPDDFALMSADRAEKAGAALAQTIDCKFRFVEAPHMAPATGPADAETVRSHAPSRTVEPAAPPGLPGPDQAASSPEASTEQADWMESTGSHLRGLRQRLVDSETPTVLARPGELDDYTAAILAETPEEPAPQDAVPPPLVRIGRHADETPVELPITLGEWRLRPIDMGLQWEHSGTWSLTTIWGIFYRIVLGIVFIFLGVLTIQSSYAHVQPEVLPYVAIVLGLGLIVSGLRLTVKMMRMEALVIDKVARQVRRHLDLTSDVRATYDFENIEAVVVTQFAQQKQRGRDGQPDRMTHEAWLHLLLYEVPQEPGKARDLKPEDSYVTIGHVELTEGEYVPAHFEVRKRDRVPQPLYAEEATTLAQKAAIAIARMIDVDVFIDQR